MIDTLPRRRKKGPPPMSARLSMATREVLKRQGFADMHILRHWPEIVGRSLAELSAPEKLTFPRGRAPSDGRKRARPEGATLTVRIDGAAALEFQHLEPQIIQRINNYYGYGAVQRLKLVQGPLPMAPRKRRKSFRGLTPEEEQGLNAEVKAVENQQLRESLLNLGRLVMGTIKPRA